MIELNGAKAGNGAIGLTIANGTGTVIRGLVINRFSGGGILISGNQTNTNGNTISGCFIGTDPTGMNLIQTKVPNFQGNAIAGIIIQGSSPPDKKFGAFNNTIGGATPDARNLISGNSGPGILIGAGKDEEGKTKIFNNYIGTDLTGKAPLANLGAGVRIQSGVSQNTIGGEESNQGNLISGNGEEGILIEDRNPDLTLANTVQGNLIGTDRTGNKALGNGRDGIFVKDAAHNLIGGSTVGARNIISGNSSGVGVHILGVPNLGEDSSDNKIQGNYIGTNLDGSARIPNGPAGVWMEIAGPGNIVGGSVVQRNIVSGNGGMGIRIDTSNKETISNNYIGLDATGSLALGNNTDGIYVAQRAANTSISLNVISANGYGTKSLGIGNGIRVDTSINTNISLNIIGTNVAAKITDANNNPLGNRQDGIFARGLCLGINVTANVIGGNNGWGFNSTPDTGGATITLNFIGKKANSIIPNKEGGINDRAGGKAFLNLVAWNLGPGIRDVGGPDSLISQNSIFSNSGLGIDEGPLGPTLAGVPLLTSAMVSAGNTEVIGTLNSAPSTTYNLEFFGNDQADPSGYGQGQTYLGSATVTTDSTGYVSFDVSVPSAYGAFVTATATDPNSNTTEFSNDILVQTSSSGRPITGVSPSSGSINGGSAVIISGSGFAGATAVLIGGIPASFTVNSDNQITALAPTDSAGTVVVSVTTSSGTSIPSLAAEYVYLAPPAPVVTGLGISSGPTGGGTVATINGSGFTGAAGVFFGDSPAQSFTVLSDTQISAVSPPEPAGTVDIEVVTYYFSAPTSADQFTYQAGPLPAVTGVSPNLGSTVNPGWVIISGTGFTTATDAEFRATISLSIPFRKSWPFPRPVRPPEPWMSLSTPWTGLP